MDTAINPHTCLIYHWDPAVGYMPYTLRKDCDRYLPWMTNNTYSAWILSICHKDSETVVVMIWCESIKYIPTTLIPLQSYTGRHLTSSKSLHRWTKASTCAKILLLSSTQPTGEYLWCSLDVCREKIEWKSTWKQPIMISRVRINYMNNWLLLSSFQPVKFSHIHR